MSHDQYDEQPNGPDRESGSEGRGPSFVAYTVKDRGPEKSAAWTRVGAAWEHRDGKGFDVQLEATPVDGRVTLREQRREAFKAERQEQSTPDRAQDRTR